VKRKEYRKRFHDLAELFLTPKLIQINKEREMSQAKPFLQLRKALKRNATFDSDEVREQALHLLDSLEQDVEDIVAEDEEFDFSSTTERYSADLKEALEVSEKEADEEEGD